MKKVCWVVPICAGAVAALGFAQTTRSDPAEREIAEVHEALVSALSNFAAPREIMPGGRDFESVMSKVSAVMARLDLFEMRFGTDRTKLRRWEQVPAAAKVALKPTPEQESGTSRYFAGDSYGVTLGMLLELIGDPDRALELLRSAKPGGGSGNWHATVMLQVHTRESAILQRRGEWSAALEAIEKAIKRCELALHSKNLPELYCRHAFLLEKNRRNQEALAEYQRVVDLFPGTVAAGFASSALTSAGKLVPPSAARMEAYLETDRMEAIAALAKHRFPESLQMLAAQLDPKKGWSYAAAIDALGELGDRKAVPVLARVVAEGDPDRLGEALSALRRLGDTSHVVDALRRMEKAFFVNAEELHPLLVEIHGGGPDFDLSKPVVRPKEFAGAWLAYIEARKASSRPDSRR